jgi:hypothetical protein
MIEHIVLFKFNDNATTAQIEALTKGLHAMATEIPGIHSLVVSENKSSHSKGYTLGLVVRFTDWAALEAYIPHPVHQALVTDLLGPIHADLVAFDYEI